MARPVHLFLLMTAALLSPASGQEAETGSAAALESPAATEAAASADDFGPYDEGTVRGTKSQEEILVTAQSVESGLRVLSTSDEKAAAAAAAARTPCAGCVEVSGSSVSIGFGRPPPLPLMIDLKAIPEAPAGSDAARYAAE